ncbi:hypothetical protein FRC01_008222 [Tulasnella sp. 417]|nr:hypothetical protein FRC01_008222 [Tulasnella sp. 417]
MLLGYGTVLLGTITLQHGAISARPKSSVALQNLLKSFEDYGVLRYSNPIVLLIEPDDLDGDQALSSRLDGEIPSVKFKIPAGANGAKPVVLCAAGQHREAAVLKRIEMLEAEEDGDEPGSDELVSRIQAERVWAAAFYRKSSVLKPDDPSATAVGNLLSSNQRLWQWEATPQELWQLGLRWIFTFGTEKEVLLKAIGETRRFPWLGGLVVKGGWRDALTTLLKYPGLNKDALLKDCGRWCSQPYSQIALTLLEGLVSHMVALSSTAHTHYPELWDKALATFLLDQWATVNAQILDSPESQHDILIDEYRKDISQHLVDQWANNVVMEEGETSPTVEDIELVLAERFEASIPPFLSWEGLKPKILQWEACGEALNEIARWLDPSMGAFHSKAHGSIKLGTSTEYLWSDAPKEPNATDEEHQADLGALFAGLYSELRNMSIAVMEVRGRSQIQLSKDDISAIDNIADYYVNLDRVSKKAASGDAESAVDASLLHHVENLMRHSAIQFYHFGATNRPRNYRRYITALVSESELQKEYLPALRLQASVRKVRSAIQDFYQKRNPNLSIFWNDYGGTALQKGKSVADDETYDQHLQSVAREAVMKQLAAPYKRLVESGSIPRGLGREAMLKMLGAISSHLGGEDADLDADATALKTFLGPSPSDEEYEPSDEPLSDSEPAGKRSSKPKRGQKKPSKGEKDSSGTKGKKRRREASDTVPSITQATEQPPAADLAPPNHDADTETDGPTANSSASQVPISGASANLGPSGSRGNRKAPRLAEPVIESSADGATANSSASHVPISGPSANLGRSGSRGKSKAPRSVEPVIDSSENVGAQDLRGKNTSTANRAASTSEARAVKATPNPFKKSATGNPEGAQAKDPRPKSVNPFAVKRKAANNELSRDHDPFQASGVGSSRRHGAEQVDTEIEELSSAPPASKKSRTQERVTFIGRRIV